MWRALLKDEEQGPQAGEVEALARRHPFSVYLPYRAYFEDRGEYLNVDNTYGRLWECRPLAFAGPKALESLAGLLRQEHPPGTTISLTLFPDDHIDALLAEYLALKTRGGEVSQAGARHYAEHLRAGRQGLARMGGIPVRNFRLFVAIKSAESFRDERVKSIEEALSQAGLAPTPCPPGILLDVLRRVFNGEAPRNATTYDSNRYLSNQIIGAETVVRHDGDHLRLGSRYAACLSPKSLSTNGYIDSLEVNRLIGGFGGPQEDGLQLGCPFLWTTTVFFQTQPADIRRKAAIMMAQRVGGTIAKAIGRRVQELTQDLEDLEKDRFVDVITSMWVFGEQEEDLNRAVARARSLWEAQRFVMQRETKIAPAMLIQALPFGLYATRTNIEILDRHFTLTAMAAAHLLPSQADFAGRMRPVQLYVGRKGQLASIDVFDRSANNHNFLVCAGSGAGKSFMTNKLVADYYATGALIRLIDIGYSYEKQTLLSKGRYIDVGGEAGRLCLNPFTSSVQPDRLASEDRQGDELTVTMILLSMAFSATQVPATEETLYSLMKDAVRFARARDGGLRGVDHVEEYLRTYPALAGDRVYQGATDLAHKMAFNLYDFTSRGHYGSLFNGPSTLNIASDEFVVLELEKIMNNTQLFQVIALQVINAITQDLYLSDRTARRFMLFDEAWKYFSSTPMIAKIIEEGYRRARKYGGATGIITQSPLDLAAFGTAGVVIKSNSAFKFYLESTDYEKAVRMGLLDYDGLLLDLAKSVRNASPRYSEILIDTPRGAGVLRLCPDRYTYWWNTTTGHEVARFKQALVQHGSAAAAIEALVAAEVAA